MSKVSVNKSEILTFPLGKDQDLSFAVYETNVMHPSLQAKFPGIKSYKGVSLDASKKTIVFTYSDQIGFFGVFESKIHEKTEIKPLRDSLYEFTLSSSKDGGEPFSCETENYMRNQLGSRGSFDRNVDDGNLRRYRLALSVSGDYSQVFLDGSESDDLERKAKVLQAMVGSVNRLNGIFERDFGITMQLIEESDLLIFLNPFTDPYSTSFNLRNELVTTLNNTITNNDYDVGHLFHKETNAIYGNAGCIACVCINGEKGQAYSVHGNPDTDGMNLLAAHEFGHQFGAFHTQSSNNCRSGFNSEVEPGSGSTIMSYAGICPPNVQSGADDYFNYTSIRDVANWTINNSGCAELIPTGNNAPIIVEGADYVIPKSTPFVLTGDASDVDGNETLTYCWEQNDSENPNSNIPPQPTNRIGPMFRSFPPEESNQRYFPNLDDVLANNLTPEWEVLPSVSRALNFVLTVRDNGSNGGQAVSDAVVINVNDNAGPFVLTSQTDGSDVWTVGELLTVSWDVAGTNVAPINLNEVEILLSTDGGQTFSTNLIVTENDGEETFNLPDVDATSHARIMLKAYDNVFFAVNQQEFTIEKSEYSLLSNDSHINACDSQQAVFNLEYKTFLTFNEEVMISASNLPSGTSANFSQEMFNGESIEGTPFIVTLTDLTNLDTGNYSFNVEGVSATNVQKSITLSFTLFSPNDDTVINLVSPSDEADAQELGVELIWGQDDNAVSYQIEVATDDTFTNIIEDAITTEASFNPEHLENNLIYYWRVQSLNPCGASEFSDVYSFSTECSSPENLSLVASEMDNIEITWEDLSSSNSWNVEYGVSGFVLGTGVNSEESVRLFKVEGLESGTKYDFYISGNCTVGGSSPYIGPLTVSTESDYCNGDHFYDSGGPDNNYKDNENTITSIYPDTDSERVRVRFNNFNVHYGYDYLSIYNGEDDTASLIGAFTGNELIEQEFVATNDSGVLTFIFTSNSFLNFSGWDAEVICEEQPNCFEPINFETVGLKGDEVSFTWTPVGTDDNWELEYGLSGFVQGNGTIVTASEPLISIEGLTPFTSYEVYIKTICDAGGFSEVLGPFRIVTTELCSTPSDLNITSFTNDTATFVWENLNDNVSNWEVEYGENGFTLGSGTKESVLEKNISIASLISNTAYQLYVRSNCEADGDGFSNWTEPINFKTSPDYCNGDHFYDSGGPNGNYSNNENSITTIHPKTLEERIRVQFNSFLVESCCDYLIVYDGPDTQSPLIGFYTSNPGMLVSTHETGALTFVFSSDSSVTRLGWDATVICEEKPNCLAPDNFRISSIETRQVDLSWSQIDNETNWTLEYGESGFILGEGTELTSETTNKTLTGLMPETSYDVYIKTNCAEGGFSDVEGPLNFITPIACFVPQNLITTSISNTSADLTWNPSISNESTWEIEYGVHNFTLGEGNRSTFDSNSASIQNLEPNTEYDAYVRANCDLDGYSNWSMVLRFKTNCNTIIAPIKRVL